MEVSRFEETGPRLLSWEEMLQRAGEPIEFACALRREKTIGARVESWLGFWVKAFPSAVVFRTLHSAGYAQILQIWSDQVLKAKRPFQAVSENLVPRPYRAPSFLRRHHQLLCDPASVVAKFERIQAVCGLDDQILLVGDDDQVSPLLAGAGYRNVTVIDIDERLVKVLAESSGGSLRARVHDLNGSPAPELLGEYSLIVMDPPYSLEGIRLFLDGALKFMKGSTRPKLHLYCASVCLGREGVVELQQELHRRGFGLREFHPGICRYPYPRVLRWGFIALYAAAAWRLGVYQRFFRASLIPDVVSSDLWEAEGAARFREEGFFRTASPVCSPGP